MKKFLKDNLIIIISFSLPIVFILVMLGVVYIPSYYVKTDYNFIYLTCKDSGYSNGEPICNFIKNNYRIENNKLVVQEIGQDQDINGNKILDKDENKEVKFFKHNNKENLSTELTIEELEKLNINPKITSDDGYEVVNKNSYGGPFSSGGERQYYLVKDNLSKKLDLKLPNNEFYYGDNNYKFLGWIKE